MNWQPTSLWQEIHRLPIVTIAVAANIALAQYGLQDAERLLDQALAHVSEDPIERIGVLHEQNIVFRYALKSGRWRENLDMMQALLESVEQPPLPTRLVFLMDRSRYFDVLGYGQQGVESAKAAVIVAEELNDLQAIAHAHDILASTYWKAGMMNEANQAFERALQHARVIGDRNLEGRTLSARARNGIFTDLPSTQIHDLLTRVFDIAVATDNKDLMVDSLGKLGYWRISVGLGDFDLAEQDLRRAIRLGGEIGKAPEIVLRFGNLGWLFANKGDYRQALTALDFSQSAAQEGATYFVHWVNVGRRGNAWMEMGCFETAGVLFHEAIEMLNHHGSRAYEAQARCDLGWLHLLTNRPREAKSLLSTVLDFAEEIGNLRLKALACTRLGYVLESTGRLGEAFEKYDAGCDLHHRMEQHYYAMNARAGLARIAASQGDNDTALDHVAIIWKTIGGKEMDATIETARTLRTCYTIFHAHGDPRADEVLAMALEQLHRRVSSIDDPAHVEHFWQIEDHRFFLEVAARGD